MSALVEIEDLVMHYPIAGGERGAVVHALDGVSLTVSAGETLGVVGESGSGKSSLGRCLVRLERPTSGTVRFDGREITGLGERDLRPLRRDLQMVFQDSYSSLNPRKRVGATLAAVLEVNKQGSKEQISTRVGELLELVGLSPQFRTRYPHELSGGQRQRVGIARAIALNPRVVVTDEPVSALDVSIQAQILNLLEDLQDELGLTYVMVAHDLGVVRQVADRVAVMYLGKLVEVAPRDALFESPHHPYTEALLSAVPIPDPRAVRRRERIVLRGEIPSPVNPPSGCRFRTRCPHAAEICTTDEPALVAYPGGRLAACHFPRQVAAA